MIECDAIIRPTPISWNDRPFVSWNDVKARFLRMVTATQRHQVAALLSGSDARGRGLRTWVRLIAARDQCLTRTLPAGLVQVYLDDDEALPLHDCAGCGLAVPVQSNWRTADSDPQYVYFPRCPCCGGQTGLYAAWSQCDKWETEPVAK